MADKTITSANANNSGVVKIGSENGHTVINRNSLLRRLNYFDGKFLRAPDLILEQQALLNQMRISNQAGGFGVVHGYDCTSGNSDNLIISAGLAIDAAGRVLLLSDTASVDINELIEKSRSQFVQSGDISSGKSDFIEKSVDAKETGAGFDDCVVHSTSSVGISATDNNSLYVITLNHSEAYCGEEDVYGKLCSEACNTSSNRSYIIEGIEVRAVPLNLSVLLKQSKVISLSQQHLRSRVASAYYQQERELNASHISADGLSSSIWCLGAEAANSNGVPIAILARNGKTTLFLDAWTIRRERMGSPSRQYWAGRMAMRSWQVFLAQVLQFQCHLRSCLSPKDPNAPCKTITEFDPCSDTRKTAAEAAQGMRYLIDSMGKVAEQISAFYGQESSGDSSSFNAFRQYDGGMSRLEQHYQKLVDSSRIVVPKRLLINCGIIEVPSAGYLPVNPSATITVNEQVERLLGEGVDLRFCIVSPDYVPHALEEAQHMERICLLTGLDNPEKKPRVDVLVPNGEIVKTESQVPGSGYQAHFVVNTKALTLGWPRTLRYEMEKESSQLSGANDEVINALLHMNTNMKSVSINQAEVINSRQNLPEIKGAARGEQLESDGFAFYMALQSSDKQTLDSAILSQANQKTQQILKLLDGQANSQPGVEIVEEKNSEPLEKLSAGLRINSNATGQANRLFLLPSVSMWVDLKSNRNPFNLATGEQTDVQAKIILVYAGGNRDLTIEERIVHGELHITRSAPQNADTKLTARLIADGSWKKTITREGNSETRSEAVSFDEILTIRRTAVTGLPSTISIVLVNPSFFAGLGNVKLVFQRIWTSATESTVRTSLLYQFQEQQVINLKKMQDAVGLVTEGINNHAEGLQTSQEIILCEGVLHEDAAALKPGSSSHSASLTALNQISGATAHTGFSDSASKLLFPSVQQIPQELRILARESWVMFHRRRDKVCEQVTAQDITLKARHYRVYHVHIDREIDTQKLVKALQTDASSVIAKFTPVPVDIVQYSPGIVTVETNHADVRADWQAAVKVDADVHIGVIASQGEVLDEGDVLANGRLQNLTDVLSTVSETADDLALFSIAQVPPTLASGEVDGVIIYFTKAVATICHEVHRLVSNNADEFVERISALIEKNPDAPLSALVQEMGAGSLASKPRFVARTDQFYGDNEAQQLIASWDLLNDGPVSRVLTFASNENAEQQLITVQQAKRITQTVGSSISADDILYQSVPAGVFRSCSKTTVLIAGIECHEVYIFTPISQDHARLLTILTSMISEQGLTSQMLESNADGSIAPASTFTRINSVGFYRDSSQFENSSQDQFSIQWQRELGGNAASSIDGFYLVVARSGASAQETEVNLKLAQEQGEKIRELIGINSSALVAVTNNQEVTFPSNCRFITLVVVPQMFELDHFASAVVMASAANSSEAAGTPVANEDATLSLELSNAVKFDENNEIIRDATFNTALAKIVESGTKIKKLEIVSIEDTVDAESDARAKALLKVLKEEGAANNNAKVVAREASSEEKVEIVRTGFVLNGGFLLK